MGLLDDTIDASGGMARWSGLNRFTLHLSIGGTLLAAPHGAFRDVIAEGSTRTQAIRFIGLTPDGTSGTLRSDAVAIENADDSVVDRLQDPAEAFTHLRADDLADPSRLILFCGVTIWNCLMVPFLLAASGTVVEELPLLTDVAGVRRRLRAKLPPHPVPLAPELICYFDDSALLRRIDYDSLGLSVAQASWAHQAFGGIVVPTLHRIRTLRSDGSVNTGPALVDIEIFDASFA
jgi:hypothetical protein